MSQQVYTPHYPMDLFIAKLNQQQQIAGAKPLTRNDITIMEVKESIGVAGTNTAVKVGASPKSTYSGAGLVRINRTDIRALLQGIDIVIDPSGYYNLVELLPILERSYGLKLEHTDIINTRLPTTLPNKVLLRMAPTNLALFGMVEITLKETGTDLGDMFKEAILSEEMVALNQPNMIAGSLLLRNINFISAKTELDRIVTGTSEIFTVLELLKRFSPYEWVCKPHLEDFNLFGGICIQHKTTDDGDEVVVVKLNPQYCKNISGQLELYYG